MIGEGRNIVKHVGLIDGKANKENGVRKHHLKTFLSIYLTIPHPSIEAQ